MQDDNDDDGSEQSHDEQPEEQAAGEASGGDQREAPGRDPSEWPVPSVETARHPAFEPAQPASVDRLELVEPSFWTRGMTIAAVVLAVGAFWMFEGIVAMLQAPDVPWQVIAMVAAPPTLFIAYILWRLWDRPSEPREVIFEDQAVVLPVSENSKRTREVAYEDLHGIMALTRAGSDTVVIDTGSQAMTYSDGQFERPDAARLLREELLRRIRPLPSADQVRQRMRERQKLVRIATSKPATATKVILGILAGYFAVQLWTGAGEQPLGLVDLGANAPALIADGQYFRLISANFLHGGWLHLILNGIALLFLGGAVEKLMGSWRLVLIYLLGAIGGSLGSYWFGPGMMSVGSSTAIFGVFGAFFALHVRYWSQLAPPFRQSVRWWVVIVGINVALPLVVPVIDYAAHLAGFAAGALPAFALLVGMEQLKPDHRPSIVVKGLTAALAGLFAVALAWAGIYAMDDHPEDRELVLNSMLQEALDDGADPSRANEMAWLIAIDPDASRAQLERAQGAAAEIVEHKPDQLEYRDTLATLHYRLAMKSTGDERREHIAEAVELERRVLADVSASPRLLGSGEQVFASQLARFLDYHRQVLGPVIRQQVLAEAPVVNFDAAAHRLVVEAGEPAAEPVAVYAVARLEGRTVGLARTCLDEGEQRREISEHDTVDGWSDALDLHVALVEPADACDDELRFWSMADEIAELP